MRELTKSAWNYTLFDNEQGDFLFTVLCGSVGLYEISIRLTPAETAQYEKDGTTYLDTLADTIRSNEAAFWPRHIG